MYNTIKTLSNFLISSRNDIFSNIGTAFKLVCFGIRYLNREFFLKSHNKFNSIKAVEAQILLEISFFSNLWCIKTLCYCNLTRNKTRNIFRVGSWRWKKYMIREYLTNYLSSIYLVKFLHQLNHSIHYLIIAVTRDCAACSQLLAISVQCTQFACY